MTGEASRIGPTALLDAGRYYRRFFHVQPGVELYNNFGEVGRFAGPPHQVFPTLDVRAGDFDLNIGVGLPLTNDDDCLTSKSLLDYSCGAVRPECLFHRGQRATSNE